MDQQPPDNTRSEESQAERLTVTEAAQCAGVSHWIISSWITRGELPVVRVHGSRFIHPADLAATQARAHVGSVLPRWRRNPQQAGKRLRQLREAAGLNQQELAAASGLTHEAISRLETGTNAPYAETVHTLARALGVEPERFLGRDQIALTLLTTTEAASRLDVPARRVQSWLKKGELSEVKVSGQWRVPAVAVAELAKSGRLRGRSGRLDPRYRG